VPDVISLRYHIVSLVAVFLALALGIVVGSTVLQEGTVSVLRATSERVRSESERNSRENVALKQEQARLQSFGAAVLPELVQGRLKGRSVVLVDTDKVDSGMRDAVRKVLEDAGAQVDGQITFSDDRLALVDAEEKLRYAAGNLYLNDKPTGAVVAQQPFGGSRASGTNDKAGSMWNLIRWVSPRTIKETFVPATDYRYPFMGSDGVEGAL